MRIGVGASFPGCRPGIHVGYNSDLDGFKSVADARHMIYHVAIGSDDRHLQLKMVSDIDWRDDAL